MSYSTSVLLSSNEENFLVLADCTVNKTDDHGTVILWEIRYFLDMTVGKPTLTRTAG